MKLQFTRALALAGSLFLVAATASAPDPAPPPADVSAMSASEATAMVQALMPDVERLRGGKFKRPVPVKVVGDSDTRQHMASRLLKFYPPEELRVEELAYGQLGLLPPHYDMMGSILDLFEEQAGGYYDPGDRAFFILGDMPRAAAPIIMAHELTHALDDAHYNLDAMIAKTKGNGDRETAIGAVIEGSGTVIMSEFAIEKVRDGSLAADAMDSLADTEAGRSEKLKAAPAILSSSLVAPYILGQNFLLRGDPARIARPDRVSADIDRALRNPPLSTEQILHPEKYWDDAKRDIPRTVSLADMSKSLGKGWKLAGSDTLGELTLALLAGSKGVDPTSATAANPASWTNAAAAGWGGDRWQVYAKGEVAVTVLATVWDTEKDAAEFESALLAPENCRHERSRDAVVLVCGAPGNPEPPGPQGETDSAAGNAIGSSLIRQTLAALTSR